MDEKPGANEGGSVRDQDCEGGNNSKHAAATTGRKDAKPARDNPNKSSNVPAFAMHLKSMGNPGSANICAAAPEPNRTRLWIGKAGPRLLKSGAESDISNRSPFMIDMKLP